LVGGRYRIDALIGGGGFGAVYCATQLNLGRAVAIKFLHPGLFAAEGAHERFCREAQLAQQLKHPNTVRVYDFGRSESGLPFIVWEHLEGQPLDALVAREGAQPPARVVRIASQVLKALMEAHALGIVHRDIKPANLFISNFSGEPDFVKVLDFGVAKTVSEQGPAITSDAMPVGTPSYMAPEQVRTEPVGPATDLYALGLVMAELLCGRAVIQGRSLVDVFMARRRPSHWVCRPRSSTGLAMVVGRATEKALPRLLQLTARCSLIWAPAGAPEH
jgi:serine/threonine-protein kinase